MCGIAGTTKKLSESQCDAVLTGMYHRGPDGHGVHTTPLCTFFHRRLSIIDLDTRALQPMANNDESVVLVFNGEIYNYQILREELKGDYVFKTTSDTEVILHGYEKYGNGIWEKLSGMFAVALYDTKEQKIILVRDHAGIKPLYYHFDGQDLSFASELHTLHAFLPHGSHTDLLSREALELFFALGYIPSPATLYTNVFQVERSHILEYSLQAHTLTTTSFTYQEPEPRAVSLKQSLQDSVIQHLLSDVPMGLFFSGGVDSSLMAGILREQGAPLQSYSLIMPGRDEDYQYGKKIAALLDLPVSYSEFDAKAFEEAYVGVTRSLDIPLSDGALFPTWYISKQAKKDVTVVLSGEGGDELFFGYPRQRALAHAKRAPFLKPLMHLTQALPPFQGKGLLFQKLAELCDPAAYYMAACSPAFAFLTKDTYTHMKALLEKEREPLFYDREFYLENMLLRKLDVTTMQHSLEGRVPLLAPELFRWSNAAASDFTASDGLVLKPALKAVLAEYVPQELIERPKSGFGFQIAPFMATIPLMRDDFALAYAFLREWGVSVALGATEEWLLEKKPGIALAMILVHRSVINCNRDEIS